MAKEWEAHVYGLIDLQSEYDSMMSDLDTVEEGDLYAALEEICSIKLKALEDIIQHLPSDK